MEAWNRLNVWARIGLVLVLAVVLMALVDRIQG
jgi:hypothetical protein